MVTSRAALSRSISRLRMASFSNSLTIHHGLFQNPKRYLSLLFSNKLSFPSRSATSPSRVAIAASRSWNTFSQRLCSDFCFTFSLYSFSLSLSPSSKFWLLQKYCQTNSMDMCSVHPRSSAFSLACEDSPKEVVYFSFQSSNSPSYLKIVLHLSEESRFLSPFLERSNVLAAVLHLRQTPSEGILRLL